MIEGFGLEKTCVNCEKEIELYENSPGKKVLFRNLIAFTVLKIRFYGFIKMNDNEYEIQTALQARKDNIE